jgi:uncharacterized protein YcnI
MHKKLITTVSLSFLSVALLPAAAFAHVVVTPHTAGIAEELTFSVSVPNERNVSVSNIKLLIPSGVTDVIPTVHSGWMIDTQKTTGSSSEVSAIIWSAGSIPVGQREDFSFSAQVPGAATTLDWKAYQTYSDGTIVHWDQTPSVSDDSIGNAGPYSVTTVSNDLTTTSQQSPNNTLGIVIAISALILSIFSLFRRQKR